MMRDDWGSMGAAMPLMMLIMLLFWVAIIVGSVWLVRWAWTRSRPDHSEGADAMEVASRRYARGELTREEYRRLRDELTSSQGGTVS